jgi:cell division protein FtsX
LSTLERRREIAVMKAVGLQRERVLGMLLTENGILGLLGGTRWCRIGPARAAGHPVPANFAAVQDAISIPYLTAGGLMMLCVFVALVAAFAERLGCSGRETASGAPI